MIGHLYNVARSIVREHGKARSDKWRTVRDAHLKIQPACAACGSLTRVQVHHISPYHLHPELELDPNNLITLCMGPEECHLRLGHGGSFLAFVPKIVLYASVLIKFPEQRDMYVRVAEKERIISDPLI